jgi:predicted PurR-regulated permease PerM
LASDLSTTPAAPRRLDVPPVSGGGNSGMKTAAIIVVVIPLLYFGREVFVPIALSILLSFALAPPVRWLRRIHVPRILAVISVVALAFAALAAFSMVVAWQVADLAQSLPPTSATSKPRSTPSAMPRPAAPSSIAPRA